MTVDAATPREKPPGAVAAIWIKRAPRRPMAAVAEAELIAGRGILGNADQGGWRQVTLIDEAAWRDATRELGVEVDPANRRANILLRGINLEASRGRLLRIGETVLKIRGETRPCQRMDEAREGLRRALGPHWRAGVFAQIVKGGVIRRGDDAEWMEDPEAAE